MIKIQVIKDRKVFQSFNTNNENYVEFSDKLEIVLKNKKYRFDKVIHSENGKIKNIQYVI